MVKGLTRAEYTTWTGALSSRAPATTAAPRRRPRRRETRYSPGGATTPMAKGRAWAEVDEKPARPTTPARATAKPGAVTPTVANSPRPSALAARANQASSSHRLDGPSWGARSHAPTITRTATTTRSRLDQGRRSTPEPRGGPLPRSEAGRRPFGGACAATRRGYRPVWAATSASSARRPRSSARCRRRRRSRRASRSSCPRRRCARGRRCRPRRCASRRRPPWR